MSPSLKSLAYLLPAERWLLAFVVHGAPGSAEALGMLTDEALRGLVAEPALRVARALAPHTKITAAALVSALANGNCALIEEAAGYEPPPDFTALECVRVLRRRPFEARMVEIQKRLAGASGSELDALLVEKLRLRRQMAGL